VNTRRKSEQLEVDDSKPHMREVVVLDDSDDSQDAAVTWPLDPLPQVRCPTVANNVIEG
jgi:hypothetical protein